MAGQQIRAVAAAGPEGAAEMRELVAQLGAALGQKAAEISAILAPQRRIDGARLNLLMLATTQLVHSGHRMLARSGPMQRADAEAAGDDPAARAAVQRTWAALGLPLTQLRLELNKWPLVESALRPQVVQQRTPLFGDGQPLSPAAAIREEVTDLLFEQIHRLLNPQDQDPGAMEHGCFADIPLDHGRFLVQMHAALRCLRVLKPGAATRFLDVGCGCGLKVISAAPYFDRCAGLEYDPGYAARAEELFERLRNGRCRAIQGDALAFGDYGDFDVIYFYQPIREPELLAQMERRIVAQAPEGTLLVAPYRGFAHRAESHGCGHVGGHLWVTGRSDAQAAELREDAEHVGMDVLTNGPGNVPLVWDPVIAAARQRGYEPALRG